MATNYGKIIATGGSITRYISNEYVYVVHTFSYNNIFSLNKNIDIDYLVVAGGGGSATSNSGGGGGGGVLIGSFNDLNKDLYYITVGSGGTPNFTRPQFDLGQNGGDSVFNGLTAKGGGCGAYYTVQPSSGGSGGGGAHRCCGLVRASGISGQGYNGGFGEWAYGYGGGGGAGEAGVDGTLSSAGNGGNGILSDITGNSVYYGGGGGGGVNSYGNTVASGIGGFGGGGNSGVKGVDGLGGGAGGNSGFGGRGVVIVRYKIIL
jgi:hypothetical protein